MEQAEKIISKIMEDLNIRITQNDTEYTYIQLHSVTTKYAFVSSEYETFTRP